MKIRQIVIAIIIGIIILAGIVVAMLKGDNTGEVNSDLQTLNVSEVTRSVFYAPQYVAIAKGYFEEQGLKIDLVTGQGAETPLPR